MNLNNLKYQTYLITIGLLSIGIFNFLLQFSLQNTIYNDAANYAEAAFMLYKNGHTHYFRPSLLALLHGIPFLFGSKNVSEIYAFSFYLNLLCWLGFLLIFFKLLKLYFDPKKSFYIAISTSLLFGVMALLFQTLSENVFMLILICAFHNLSKYYKVKQYFYFSIAISFFIIAILVRPGIMFFTILLFVFFIKTIFQNISRKANIIILCAVALVLLHAIGMKKQYGTFTISYIDAYTYYNYLGTRADFFKTDVPFSQGSTARNQYILKHKYQYYKHIAAEDFKYQWRHNTYNLCKAYFFNFIENTKTGSTAIYDVQNINKSENFEFWKIFIATISKWQNRILTIAGLFMSLYIVCTSFKKREATFYISLFVLYTIATSAVSCCQGDRLHLVFFPFVLLLGAVLYGSLTSAFEPLQK